jgi:hypothetical protein
MDDLGVLYILGNHHILFGGGKKTECLDCKYM